MKRSIVGTPQEYRTYLEEVQEEARKQERNSQQQEGVEQAEESMLGDKSGGGPNIIGNEEDKAAANEDSSALLLPPFQAAGGLGQRMQPSGAAGQADEIMYMPASITQRRPDREKEALMAMKMPTRGHSKDKKVIR